MSSQVTTERANEPLVQNIQISVTRNRLLIMDRISGAMIVIRQKIFDKF